MRIWPIHLPLESPACGCQTGVKLERRAGGSWIITRAGRRFPAGVVVPFQHRLLPRLRFAGGLLVLVGGFAVATIATASASGARPVAPAASGDAIAAAGTRVPSPVCASSRAVSGAGRVGTATVAVRTAVAGLASSARSPAAARKSLVPAAGPTRKRRRLLRRPVRGAPRPGRWRCRPQRPGRSRALRRSAAGVSRGRLDRGRNGRGCRGGDLRRGGRLDLHRGVVGGAEPIRSASVTTSAAMPFSIKAARDRRCWAASWRPASVISPLADPGSRPRAVRPRSGGAIAPAGRRGERGRRPLPPACQPLSPKARWTRRPPARQHRGRYAGPRTLRNRDRLGNRACGSLPEMVSC